MNALKRLETANNNLINKNLELIKQNEEYRADLDQLKNVIGKILKVLGYKKENPPKDMKGFFMKALQSVLPKLMFGQMKEFDFLEKDLGPLYEKYKD